MTSFPKECWAVRLMRTPERAIMSNCLNYAKQPWDFSWTRGVRFRLETFQCLIRLAFSAEQAFSQVALSHLFGEREDGLTNGEIWAPSKLICCALFHHEMEIPSGQGDGSWDFQRITFKGSHEIGSNKDAAHMLIIGHSLLKVVELPTFQGMLIDFRDAGSPSLKRRF